MTAPNPWPPEFAYQYTESLALARKIGRLGQASIEQGFGGSHHHLFLKRWLRLMRQHAAAIDNYMSFIAQRKMTASRMPNWVLEALETIPALAQEIVTETRTAGQLLAQRNPNYEAAELATDRAWAKGLLIEKLLLAGPAPLEDEGGDVHEQVDKLVETLDEKP
jgi:hypothetical protein